MKDSEFIKLRNRFLIALGIALIFSLPLFFFLKNNLSPKESKIILSIQKEESFFLLIREEKCESCKEIIQKLNELKINYKSTNKDRDYHYEKILQSLDCPKSDIISPTLIYIKEGKRKASIPNIREISEVEEFVESYQ